MIDLRRLHGFQEDLFGFGIPPLLTVNVGQDASGLTSNIRDGG